MNTGISLRGRGWRLFRSRKQKVVEGLDALKILEGELMYAIRNGHEAYATLLLRKTDRTRNALKKRMAGRI